MNKRIFFIWVLFVVSLTNICAQNHISNSDSNNNSDSNSNSNSNWYEIKSGVIHSRVNAGGIILEQDEYFDEWGKQVMIESKMGIGVNRLITRTIYGDKYMTLIKTEEKQGIRYPRIRPRINWMNLDEQTEQQFQIRYMGRVKLKDYVCDLYRYTIDDNGRQEVVSNWVYKGIPIQYKTVKNGIVMEQEFISLDENVPLLPSVFQIPDYVSIKEVLSL